MVLKLNPDSLFTTQRYNYPNLFQRINKQIRLGLIPMIVIDGKAQTGKSTLAKHIASYYDSKYVLAFRLEQIIEYLEWASKEWKKGNTHNVLGKWVFLDEPQLEAPRQEYWGIRNMIIQAFTSSFGFLKNGLIMALPNIKGISDIVLTNIFLRISMSCYEGKDGIVRMGYIKKPTFNEIKNKFYWTTVESYKVPEIEDDSRYMNRKVENFFDIEVERWKEKLKIHEQQETESERIDKANLEYFEKILKLANLGHPE